MISGISGFGTGMDTAAMARMRQQHFARLDTNGDGGIDKTELQVMVDRMAEKTGETSSIDEIFALLDADADGLLSDTEMPAPPPPPGGRMGNDPFSEMDTDGDGAIDKTEMAAMSEQLVEQTGLSLDVDEIFERLDANADGKIDSSERPAPPPLERMGPPETADATGLGATQDTVFADLLELLEQQEDEDEQTNNYALLQYLNQSTTQKSLFDILV
jgi:Ca2+-binding EF-hand superfamily protein